MSDLLIANYDNGRRAAEPIRSIAVFEDGSWAPLDDIDYESGAWELDGDGYPLGRSPEYAVVDGRPGDTHAEIAEAYCAYLGEG